VSDTRISLKNSAEIASSFPHPPSQRLLRFSVAKFSPTLFLPSPTSSPEWPIYDSRRASRGVYLNKIYNMETNSNTETRTNRFDNRGGRIGMGLIFVIAGSLFLAHQAGADIPHWWFSWEMILIAIGLFAGAKHNFRPGGWMVMLLIGSVFLADRLIYDFNFKPFIPPVIIIAIGLFIMLKPRGRRWRDRYNGSMVSSEDTLDTTAIFSGQKKKIITKDFKGGEITTMFGGVDLDFSQADIAKSAEIDMSIVFGGTKLIVPANWNIKSEVVCIFGGIDDKRPIDRSLPGTDKALVLKGTVIFGGIDIKSY
jgi:predicted membrane protein